MHGSGHRENDRIRLSWQRGMGRSIVLSEGRVDQFGNVWPGPAAALLGDSLANALSTLPPVWWLKSGRPKLLIRLDGEDDGLRCAGALDDDFPSFGDIW